MTPRGDPPRRVFGRRVNENGRVSSPEQDTQPINVADLLRSAARRYPDRPAVISTTGTHTWAQLDAAADAGVAALRGLGVSAGERVVIALPTGADLAASLFAAARAGVIAVPIGPSRGDVGSFADRVGAIAAISGDDDHGLPISIGPDRLAQWWTAEPVTAAGQPATGGPGADGPGAGGTRTGGAEDLALLARVREDRAVMLSHRAILAAVRAIGELGSLRLSDGERVLQVLPMYHLAGWVVAFLPLTLVGGASVLPDIGFDARTVGVDRGAMLDGAGSSAGRRATESALQAAHDHRVTVIPGAPGFFHHLVKVPGAERSLSSVRLLISGTAPLEPDDFTQVKSLLGQAVWEGYGLSESASVVTSSLATSKPHLGSVGRPLPGIELRLITPEGTDAVPTVGPPTAGEAAVRDSFDVAEAPDAGEVGRIEIRGQTLFSGYWPDGGGGPGADGWFVTGDIGYLDDAGELHLVDRAAETVTVAGFTVYPREVEDVLAGHPYVSEVAVIGLPGGDGHQQVVAVLVARPGKRPTQDDLSEYVSERLPPFKRPGAYHLVEVLPRTEVGRLDRASVQRRYAATVGVADGSAPPARLASVPAGGDEIADARAAFDTSAKTEEPDVAPEEAAGLDELGTRLPGTGDRVERGDQDTDEDLF